jgi:hypothetical protein
MVKVVNGLGLMRVGELTSLLTAVLEAVCFRDRVINFWDVYVSDVGRWYVGMTHPYRTGWIVFRYEERLVQCYGVALRRWRSGFMSFNALSDNLQDFTVEPF